ncbi:uncharacterized protein TRIADDRAFT_62627 [Trichoplax adhaerens]|uniref:G-protein coupled receptors family 1 profile domain-containing protein n=1 Tax=Trichoplax adhaerens TaxID=10228 RepID=B3SED3_TRIAD|nr:hypothetical protein TRIADDRAFT_62627 [Trichoplax adhaerens]EDV18912.1 hypothetical protein TRIADDRAFT_62627 [Trichoplax adhaerens]|eukprot:XP_002118602.1 hypothetical protein TRIADDRAFT_62627 [Trichoplax adhaerens]
MSSLSVIAAIPVLTVGILANIFVLYVITKDSYFYKVTYYLIRVTIISDIISTFTAVLGFTFITAFDNSYIVGGYLCRIFFYIVVTSYTVSVFTLCMISVDRYFAIIKPHSQLYRKHKNRFLVIAQIVSVIIAIGINLPAAWFNNVYPDDTELCDYANVNQQQSVYLISMAIVLYLIPSGILIFCYGSIVNHQIHYVRPGNITNANREDDQLRKKKFIKALIIITASFLLSTWPFFATGIGMAITGKSMRQIGKIHIILYILAFASFSSTVGIAVINPFLYLQFDQNVRKKSLKILRKLMHYKHNLVQEINRDSVVTGHTNAVQPNRFILYNSPSEDILL